jgi:Rod binding domain-containing protein
MAISPPSDIILDVTRAADPQRQQLAYDRLVRMGSGQAGTQFAAAVGQAPSGSGAGLASAREKFAALGPAKAAAAQSSATKTLRQFEAQVISTFIEQMMPQANANTFGDGMAGGVWRSMLSEQIAGQIAKAGGLGIREKVAAALAARAGDPSGQPALTADATTPAARALDRSSAAAGANSRDLRIPLSVEQHFLDATKPTLKGVVRSSISRQV